MDQERGSPPVDEVEVDRLRLADVESLARVHGLIWRATYTGLLPDAVLDSLDPVAGAVRWREVAQRLADEGPTGAAHPLGRNGPPPVADTRVARQQDGHVLGFISVGPPRDDDPPAPRELWALNLDPAWHGTGLADRLLTAALPMGPAYLWVLEGNERAIAYYGKRGFTDTGRRKELIHRTGPPGVAEWCLLRP